MNDQSVTRFWDNFIVKTKCYGAKLDAVRWYVRHAEAYIKAHQQVRLTRHTKHQVEQYLHDKGRSTYLKDWQFRQIIQSLRILFVKLAKTPWARDFPWEDVLNSAISLPDTHLNKSI